MYIAQGKIILEVSIEENTLEDLLNVTRSLNNYNLKIYDINLQTESGEFYKLKVDDINIKWDSISR
ncbi:hypothetical protein [Bacillus salipaludis]|uniref:Uncharacterized protein n=1 Tax=Bacillus salipaludis TaxID=2547811 RepID=A0AA90Z566_9BACI|nr:hypothetical protein [Bacillus salipaludis]MDQ6600742.1 hypothetical protein [Bacillus salipaludis]